MIEVKVFGEFHPLDTLNGYYRLDDLYTQVGRPKGLSPREFVGSKLHKMYSVMLTRTKTWGNQVKVYEYAAFLDPKFLEVMTQAVSLKSRELALQISTPVMHK